MQSCLKISMGSWPTLCTQNSSLIIPYIILLWQQNKPYYDRLGLWGPKPMLLGDLM